MTEPLGTHTRPGEPAEVADLPPELACPLPGTHHPRVINVDHVAGLDNSIGEPLGLTVDTVPVVTCHHEEEQ